MRHLAPGAIALIWTIAALWGPAQAQSQHGDEKMYIWKASYYGGMIANLDSRTASTDCRTDPAWSIECFWSYEQPLGTHLLYAAVMGLTGSPPPLDGFSWTDQAHQGPDSEIPKETLPIVRLTAVLFSALGLALMARRLGWIALPGVALFLLIPHVPSDLSRAWAEGPLLFGFGLCVATYGSRLFPIAAGLATGFKLTAVILWPLTLSPRANGGLRMVCGPLFSLFAFAAASPHSWFTGPYYLRRLLEYRIDEHAAQVGIAESLLPSFFLPTRYLWPFELAVCLVLAVLVPHLWRSVQVRSLRSPLPGGYDAG